MSLVLLLATAPFRQITLLSSSTRQGSPSRHISNLLSSRSGISLWSRRRSCHEPCYRRYDMPETPLGSTSAIVITPAPWSSTHPRFLLGRTSSSQLPNSACHFMKSKSLPGATRTYPSCGDIPCNRIATIAPLFTSRRII
jgi:hypothetical protein